MFAWTEKNLAWFDRAVAHTDFYHQIVNKCSELLNSESHVFDLGCGAGFLSIALAPVVRSVIAIDISPEAINFLREKCREKNLTNLFCRETDWLRWQPEQAAEVVFLCYCDGLLRHLKKISPLTKNYLVAVLPFHENSNCFHVEEFYPLPSRHFNRETVQKAKKFLEREQIPFQFMPLFCEFGQPFSCLEEYEEFFDFYFQIPRQSIPSEHKSKYLRKSQEGYYLPSRKESGIIVIKKEDLKTWEAQVNEKD